MKKILNRYGLCKKRLIWISDECIDGTTMITEIYKLNLQVKKEGAVQTNIHCTWNCYKDLLK